MPSRMILIAALLFYLASANGAQDNRYEGGVQILPKTSMKFIAVCRTIKGVQNRVLIVRTCSPFYKKNGGKDSYAVQRCKYAPSKFNDEDVRIPVTNSKTGITYKNIYCQRCNDPGNAEHAVAWNHTTRDEAPRHWFSIPDSVAGIVRNCTQKTIPTCRSNWPDDDRGRLNLEYCYLGAETLVKSSDPNSTKIYRNDKCRYCNEDDKIQGPSPDGRSLGEETEDSPEL